MTQWQLNTPVVFIIFNRPQTTQKVFEVIRQVQPPKLFVIADGTRSQHPEDLQKCAATREIINQVDWDCEVFKNYSEINLGCRQRVSSGLSWVFQQVEEAIILEDDCLPHPSFFRFCEELLAKYRHTENIFVISGNNFQFCQKRTSNSYYFSRYNHLWGWATWRRAWQHYDDTMKQWPTAKQNNLLSQVFSTPEAIQYWSSRFQANYNGFNSWGYAWTFACWYHRGLTILPAVNLVSNIGFGVEATHTQTVDFVANLPTVEIKFPLQHPQDIRRQIAADNFTEKTLFSGRELRSQSPTKSRNTNYHILLYTDDPQLGGVAQYNHSILLALVQEGYQVTCVQTRKQNPIITAQQQLGIDHIWLEFDTVIDFHRTLTNPQDAQQVFAQTQPDLIIFSDSCPLSDFAAKQVAINLKIPYLIINHFAASYLAERFQDYLDKLSTFYAQSQAVIAVSQDNLQLLHDQFKLPQNQGILIYNGRPQQYFKSPQLSVRQSLRSAYQIPEDGIVCFTSAQLSSVKGFQYQLEAIQQLQNTGTFSKLYFVWAGIGTLEPQLKAKIQKLGIENQVKLIGQRWDIPDWLDASDIFILPSEAEGMPLAIMEAMAKGLPVIASAVSGIPEELGDTGKLLPNPKEYPQKAVQELVQTLQLWVNNPELRKSVGQACQKRAKQLFQEERMIHETLNIIQQALLPTGDYVSPELKIIQLDTCFPNLTVGDKNTSSWPYLRREIPHNWYVDQRQPMVGFLSRDEAHILYNTALQFSGKKALEIGCWLGWSACHLAIAGVKLDVIDPLLSRTEFYQSVQQSLTAAGVIQKVNLIPGYSPQKVEEVATTIQQKWSLIFIDGNHDAPGPLQDAIICEKLAAEDAIILFHDLASPDVAQGLAYFKQKGWKTLIYQTMQIMGVAWRGNVIPIQHQPDPKVNWQLPEHLQGYAVSNLSQNQQFQEQKIMTETVESLIKNIIILLKQGQRVEALKVAEKAVSNYPNTPEVHYLYCLCLIPLGRHQEALAAAKTELKINPNHPQAQAQVQQLSQSLTREIHKIPTHQRPWNTSLSQSVLQSIQKGSHYYSYRGISMIKNPFDFALYPLLIWNLKPQTIIEIGSKNGGSAVWFGDLMNNFDLNGHIFSIDIVKVKDIQHKRVTFMEGNGRKLDSTLSSDWINQLPRPLLIIEDADHTYETSSAVLKFFHSYLQMGDYIIIEDGIISDLTQDKNHNSGPHRALKEFLSQHQGDYEIDENYCDFFGYNLTWCTNGFLKKIKPNIVGLTAANTLEETLPQVQDWIHQYQQQPQQYASALANLRQVRQQLAQYWLNLSSEALSKTYSGELGKLHKQLINSGIKAEFLTETEQQFVQHLSTQIAQGWSHPQALNVLLAAMLYQRADQLPLHYQGAPIPRWFANDYLKFMFASPSSFQKPGEVDQYYQYFLNWMGYVHENVTTQSHSQIWQDIALWFTQTVSFIPIYFTQTTNLLNFYQKRAEIIEIALKQRGCQLDFNFEHPPKTSGKIRLGILKDHYTTQTETYAILPIFEHLDRSEFEIILYGIKSYNHPLEQYCQSRADQLITLPTNLERQVQTIQDDNLDILFIASNVTAVNLNSSLLALHKLAPIQVTSITSPVSTGMKTIDYYIAGDLTAPQQTMQPQYCENLVNLEGSGLCFRYPLEEEQQTVYPSRESWGATQETIIFISGANFYKIIPEVRETWAKILATVPHSILVLYPFNPNWTNSYPTITFVNQMQSILEKYGVSTHRLVTIKALPSRTDIKACLKLADVYLDSYPYGGATSLIDPLEVGLPPVVLEGNTLRFRQASALLKELQIPELVTANETTYIQVATQLASNLEWRQSLQQKIQQKMQLKPPFLDSQAYSYQMGHLFKMLLNKEQSAASDFAAILLETPQQRQQFLTDIVDNINRYDLDKSNSLAIANLRQFRKVMADYWLKIPTEHLEAYYNSDMGQGYQILLNRGIQQEPLTALEAEFVEKLTPIAIGLKQANALNYLIAAMLYYVPGKMLVRDAKTRLPQWLFADYKRVFESPEILGKIQQSLKKRQAKSTTVQINNPQFINRLIGCANLYEIDPTHQSVLEEMYQLRQQVAQYVSQITDSELKSTASKLVTQAYQILLNSGFWQQPLRVNDREFLKTLGIQSPQSLNELTSIPQQLVALLYSNPAYLPQLNPTSFPTPWQEIILPFLQSAQSNNPLE
jgi:predicted O-linked N-acetylglucosamine transferase (SPINDLY family)/cephalosporin hydroxylase/glycosyltransferase involved in cell wall biosynthesis